MYIIVINGMERVHESSPLIELYIDSNCVKVLSVKLPKIKHKALYFFGIYSIIYEK